MTAEDERLETVAMVRDSAAAVVPPGGGLGRVRAQRWVAPGFDRAVWAQMAGLGWIGLRADGLGLGESVALLEALGGGLVPEPLVAAWFAVDLLAQTAETALLQQVCAGGAMVVVASQDGADGLDVGRTRRRRFVPMPGAATHVLLPLAEGAAVRLLLLAADEAAWSSVALQDGSFVGEIDVPDGVGAVVADDARAALDRALDVAALGVAAFLLGVAERAFALTLDHLRSRRQFGQALAGFQALQHRAADMKVQLILTRASVEGAAAELDGGAPPRRRAAVVSRAKARASDTALLVAREAVQMHGAIGYADEHDIGLFVRKAMVLANAFGSPLAHRRRFLSAG